MNTRLIHDSGDLMQGSKFQPGDRVSVFSGEVMGQVPGVVIGFKEIHRRFGPTYEVLDAFYDRRTFSEGNLEPVLSDKKHQKIYSDLTVAVAQIVNAL